MFLLNSCLELDIAAHRALFLPKLQSYFAEFLKGSSPALLGILYLPTCVGLRYRQLLLKALRAFLGSMTSNYFDLKNLVLVAQLNMFSPYLNTSST